MTPYEIACLKKQQLERECIAELFLECCIGNPYVQDENGKWLTREEVYNKLLNGEADI